MKVKTSQLFNADDLLGKAVYNTPPGLVDPDNHLIEVAVNRGFNNKGWQVEVIFYNGNEVLESFALPFSRKADAMETVNYYQPLYGG